MMKETVTLQIDPVMLQALSEIALSEDQTIGQIVREALKRDLQRRHKAKTSVRADERLVAPLRALLADDLAYAKSWSDLQDKLSAKGYVLREAGGGLILCARKDMQRLCKASELGYSHAKLVQRFEHPFPGHRTYPMARNFV